MKLVGKIRIFLLVVASFGLPVSVCVSQKAAPDRERIFFLFDKSDTAHYRYSQDIAAWGDLRWTIENFHISPFAEKDYYRSTIGFGHAEMKEHNATIQYPGAHLDFTTKYRGNQGVSDKIFDGMIDVDSLPVSHIYTLERIRESYLKLKEKSKGIAWLIDEFSSKYDCYVLLNADGGGYRAVKVVPFPPIIL